MIWKMGETDGKAVGKLGPVRDAQRNMSGTQEHVLLRRAGPNLPVTTVKVTLILARCGVSLLTAKRAIECMLDEDETTLLLPMVSTRQDLSEKLFAAGIGVVFNSDVGSCQH